MTEPPVITPSGEKLYQSIPSAFVKDDEHGWFGRYLAQALMVMLQDLDQIVVDTPEDVEPVTGFAVAGMRRHPGWSCVLDPAVCPPKWLPYCALIYGIRLVPGSSVAQQRAQIKALSPQKRGWRATMKSAIEGTLTGTKKTIIHERPEADAYFLQVITRTSETPKPSVTLQAILSQKPAGIRLDYKVTNSPTWEEATKTWEEVAESVHWEDVEEGDV